MKRILFLLIVLSISIGTQADNWITISENNTDESNIQLIGSTSNETSLEFNMSGFWYDIVETERGSAWTLYVDGSANRLEATKPELPSFAKSIIIPSQAKMKAEIISSEYVEYEDILIAPSKGNFDRSIKPSSIAYEYGSQYERNEFFPSSLTDLRKPYILRDHRGQTVVINPFSYNPVSKVLRVYYNIKIKISEDGISNINTITDSQINKNQDINFTNIYKRQFINFNESSSRYDVVEEQGNMLIICYGDFMDEMEPYVEWRTKTGTHVEMVDVADIGGSSQIKTYISNYYTDNGLTFVLLVGDAQQVPSSVIGGNDSDVNYSYIVGSDHYPDLFMGRFSAQTEAHVMTMVDRTIAYERNPIQMSSWYNDAIGIASSEGPGDDNEYDYVHMRNIYDTKLSTFTYTYGHELYDGTQGGEDAPGNPSPADVSNAINQGASIINYVGHGSNTAWSTSGFSNNNVNGLTNTNKLPFIISVACVNGNFVGTTCFAEAWTRAEYNDEPSGAVATFMSTINQSWDPPMHGQDAMNDILAEHVEGNIKRTFGGITMNGCMEMNDAYGSAGDEMTDTWTIFGDPSLMIRTDIPSQMTVSHPATVFVGALSLVVECDADDAIAALTMDGEIIGTATVFNGNATINFMPLDDIGTMDLVITAFNYMPYESTVEIVPADGPFVYYVDNFVNDEAGNNNGVADYSENVLLTIDLSNAGSSDAIDISSTISSNSEYVSILDDNEFYGNIAVNDTVGIADGYQIEIANNIPDGTVLKISIVTEDNVTKGLWESTFNLMTYAPALGFDSFEIDDSSGNSNGKIDPGETVDISVNLTNAGSSEAFNVIANLESTSEYITINNLDVVYGNLDAGETITGVFSVMASEESPEGTNAIFNVNISADFDRVASGEFSSFIGQKPVVVINFGAESSSSQAMASCFAELNVGADIFAEQLPEEIAIYQSAFIILGAYPNNHVLTEEEAAVINQFLEMGGKVYMEGGDTWAFDDQTEAHAKFMIIGTDDGDGDLSRIYGADGEMLQGYGFEYDGENSYIDRISPMEGAHTILMNESPEYASAISFENETYKTIGSNAGFGGLVDEDGSTKDGLMAEYLYFFGLDYLWTDIEDIERSKTEINAYPNPFSNQLNIDVSLEENQVVEISIYNLTGKRIITLSDSELQKGKHNFKWNAENAPSGIYFYTVRTGDTVQTKKIILSK